ncbi:mannitol dehydrogenase family protein [Catenovulum sp. 2E275]|uniref:mannitol dehydrogenase family protein n=1 Tax=Catenovulum sp. 2E275 TaxID=2980497 RepID=UPI0021CE25F3|nr:mannitol dehydrogenase family protein [Catenovulum sp. 2E275]MCU4677100.1 mannitol dehydrogenase family protein [Catenovulum sp. 2E275]
MRLNQQNLTELQQKGAAGVTLPSYDRENTKIGIVHIGLGAFHRSHQAFFTEKVMNKQGGNWGICGVSMRNVELQKSLEEQDCLYTLAIADKQDEFQVISALKEVLVAANQAEQVIARLANPDTKLVSLTVTEKGYCLNASGNLDTELAGIKHDIENPTQPNTALGFLVAGLAQRFEQGTAAFNVIACDNLPDNGKKLRRGVIQLAQANSAELAAWIESNVDFPNTMVDCITPATEDKTLEMVKSALGLDDLAPVQREGFDQWVIEDCLTGERPDWESVGVIFTSNVGGFEHTKLRILNGLHSTLAYLGRLCGHESVFEAVSDQALKAFLLKLVDEEIIPTIEAPQGLDLTEYSRQIIARFENPKIRHLLEQIACDGSIKVPVRTLEPINDNLNAGRSNNNALYYVVAGWIKFVANKVKTGEQLNDPKADLMIAKVNQFNGDAAHDVKLFLTADGLIDTKLISHPQIVESVISAYSQIIDTADLRTVLPK